MPVFDPISSLTQALSEGRMVILDDPEREDEGDLIASAAFITPTQVNFMMRQACGVICIALSQDRCDALALPLMIPEQQATGQQAIHGTRFTVSVDAQAGVGTGVSAFDRATTLRRLADPKAVPEDFARPGHIFPLMEHPSGLAGRRGHTEASLELMRRAKLPEAAVIVEIMHENGHALRGDDLRAFAQKHDFPIASIPQLLEN